MADSIITTKLYIPSPRPGIISRHRLVEHLNAAVTCKLSLISAPDGFGKTTLLMDYIPQLNLPVCWLTLDDGDNDLPRFLACFVAELQSI